MIIEFISILFSGLYFVFILFILAGILRKDKNAKAESADADQGVTVIIPFKNEEENLKRVIESLLNQTHVKVEFVFVDDHSEDNSLEIIRKYQASNSVIKLIHQNPSESGKKKAIEMGVSKAKHDFILTTDADCELPSEWITEHLILLEKYSAVSGIVEIQKSNGFWNVFQRMEMMAIQAISLGMGKWNKPISMSGANLSYRKEVFQRLQPYQTNSEIRSGDDIYFLHELKKKQMTVGFSDTENIRVKTQGSTVKGYFSQRIRWMKKGSSFTDLPTLFAGLLIFISSLQFIFIAGYQVFTEDYSQLFLISAGIKILVDFLLLFLVALRWKKQSILIWFLPVFLTSVIIHSFLPIFGWFIKVNWKGSKI